MSQHPISVNTGTFNLNISGVAGFFGGDEAIQAISTIHLYRARRWTGWYNAPGSFAIAKFLGPIANSRFWNALFPGPNQESETVFGLDNQSGPKYIASQSGTILDHTTHVAYLVTQQSKDSEEYPPIKIEGRITKPMTIAVMHTRRPDRLRVKSQNPPTITVGVLDRKKWLASMPILASLSACVLCAYSRDLYCLAMILLGIISNGMTCLIVGSASAVLEGVKPVENAPPGDGILMDDSSNHIVILKGEEGDVNWITKGRFRVEYLPHVWMKKKHQDNTSKSRSPPPETSKVTPPSRISRRTDADEEKAREQESTVPKEYRSIGICGLLLGIQSLLQLLLIPQGTLFGQILFLLSFVVSWVYNLYLSSLDKEKIQRRLLLQTLGYESYDTHPAFIKFKLGTRTSAAVFAALVLQPSESDSESTANNTEKASIKAIKLLERLVPNDTPVWERWRKHVGEQITTTNWTRQDTDSTECEDLLRQCATEGLSDKDQLLLQTLLRDACDALKGYCKFLNVLDQGTK